MITHHFEELPIFGSYVGGGHEWTFNVPATGTVEIDFDHLNEWYVRDISLATTRRDPVTGWVDGSGYLPHKSPGFLFLKNLFETSLKDDIEASIQKHFVRYGRAA